MASDPVPIDLRLLRQHVEALHAAASGGGSGAPSGSWSGAGGFLSLVSGGLAPDTATSPQPLAVRREPFLVGAPGPMVDAALRENRVPGRNVSVPFEVADQDAAEAAPGSGSGAALFGFALALAREPGWAMRLPFAPTAALAAGERLWAVYLLDRAHPTDEVLAVACSFASFAGVGKATAELGEAVPLAGSVFNPPAGDPVAVEVELPWRAPYRLDQLAAGAPRPRRIELPAESPDGSGGDDDDDDPEADPAPGGDDEGDVELRLGRLGVALHLAVRKLEIGSDIEIARRLARELVAALGEVVHVDGRFWHYWAAAGCWRPLDENALYRLGHAFDGCVYDKPSGRPEAVQLTTTRLKSIMRQLEALLSRPDFFRGAAVGINVANGFVGFLADGTPELTPHDPAHRQRHTLRGRWDRWLAEDPGPQPGSLLHTLLFGCFGEDVDCDDKIALVGELAGCAATGYATKLRQPKLTLLMGPDANNGKSQLLDLLDAMLPPEAVASIPASRFNDQHYVIHLVGKLFNRRDEISSAAVISSDALKNIVTGEPVSGRDLYKSAVRFRAVALHVFAGNSLPSFTGGIDRGVQRRLSLLEFNRTIPKNEQIPGIGRRIAAEEGDRLIAFAVAGAQRLLRQGEFTAPASSVQGLRRWFLSGDPVAAWVAARLLPRNPEAYLPGARDPGVRMSDAYKDFDAWQKDEGYRASIKLTGFSSRLRTAAKSLRFKHRNTGTRILGVTIGDVPESDLPEHDEAASAGL